LSDSSPEEDSMTSPLNLSSDFDMSICMESNSESMVAYNGT
jgi:hypothetical protein